jgi:hypothetical protein
MRQNSVGERLEGQHWSVPAIVAPACLAWYLITPQRFEHSAPFEPFRLPARLKKREQGRHIMRIHRRHWLDYDPVALVVLVVGLGLIELLALSI